VLRVEGHPDGVASSTRSSDTPTGVACHWHNTDPCDSLIEGSCNDEIQFVSQEAAYRIIIKNVVSIRSNCGGRWTTPNGTLTNLLSRSMADGGDLSEQTLFLYRESVPANGGSCRFEATYIDGTTERATLSSACSSEDGFGAAISLNREDIVIPGQFIGTSATP
jgi:hypothetical protein